MHRTSAARTSSPARRIAVSWMAVRRERASQFATAICAIRGAVPNDLAFYRSWRDRGSSLLNGEFTRHAGGACRRRMLEFQAGGNLASTELTALLIGSAGCSISLELSSVLAQPCHTGIAVRTVRQRRFRQFGSAPAGTPTVRAHQLPFLRPTSRPIPSRARSLAAPLSDMPRSRYERIAPPP